MLEELLTVGTEAGLNMVEEMCKPHVASGRTVLMHAVRSMPAPRCERAPSGRAYIHYK